MNVPVPPHDMHSGATGDGAAEDGAADDGAADPTSPADPAAGDEANPRELTVEDLVALVETLTAERDEATDARMRLQAEFENYRKRASKSEIELRERASESLVSKLLPALDALESGRVQGIEGLDGVHGVLWTALEREGLAVVSAAGEPFDPNQHEAVLHEGGDGGPEMVSETLRAGYSWKGRVLRPAMVKVRT